MLADPSYWPLVIDEMQFLAPGKWLGNNSIDQYLHQHWLKVKDTSAVLYLSLYAMELCARAEEPSEDECTAIRGRLLLPEDGDIDMRPVASVVFQASRSHYFTVVLNHKRLHVVTFGNDREKDGQHFDSDVNVWGGGNLWKNVCKIFRWEVPRRKPTWWAVDMKQVSQILLYYCSQTILNGVQERN